MTFHVAIHNVETIDVEIQQWSNKDRIFKDNDNRWTIKFRFGCYSSYFKSERKMVYSEITLFTENLDLLDKFSEYPINVVVDDD